MSKTRPISLASAAQAPVKRLIGRGWPEPGAPEAQKAASGAPVGRSLRQLAFRHSLMPAASRGALAEPTLPPLAGVGVFPPGRSSWMDLRQAGV
eukprot:scaffold104331_cov66-Phaeocystis_antarctica.AAC.2